eukprot:12739682-Ditylum_brightwellii.AAC.1
MGEVEGGGKESTSKMEDIIDDLYLEHGQCEEDEFESNKEDKEDCDAYESDEDSPGEAKQDDHWKPTA